MENGNARNDFGSSEDSCAVGTELIFSDKRLCVWITESQKVGGWKGPLWVTQSNPLPKQGHLQQAAENLVQVAGQERVSMGWEMERVYLPCVQKLLLLGESDASGQAAWLYILLRMQLERTSSF